MINLNLLFNKLYFDELASSNFSDSLKKNNETIVNTVFAPGDYQKLDEKICPHRFLMKTAYPGLLVGMGYAHEVESGAEQCIKLGFSFDYVSGQPYVPGSSVKGMLRSCFDDEKIIGEIVQKTLQLKDMPTPEALGALETHIFEGDDVFFDAVLRCGNREGRILAQDYITPHGHGKDETKSPNPLMMLKVLPNVIFEFRFSLQNFETEELIVSKAQKIQLFQKLIELFGIGAKTNVGYGALISADEAEVAQHLAGVRQQRAAVPASAVQTPRPAHAANSAQVHRAPAPSAAQDNERKPCPVCGYMIQSRFALCTRCRDKARQEGKCAVCGKPTGIHPGRGDHFELCRSCREIYDPR